MKYFSLFSGIGGFEHGIEKANIHWSNRDSKTSQSTSSIPSLENSQPHLGKLGYNASINPRPPAICIGFSEIDKYAISIYKKHFPNHKEYGNVSNITWSDVPDFELLCGGFPCQSFSIAGKRGGFSDTRGTLFFEIARAAQEKQPRLLLLENVKGLLSHDKGRTFGTSLNTLDELGYDLQWQVLNSKNFGVPQNRERIFIIGHLRTTSRPQIFPLNGLGMGKTHPAGCLTQRGYGSQRNGTYVESHSQTNESNSQPSGNKSNNSNIIRGASYSDDMRIRRLTPTECERLQGFPDGWTKTGIDIKGNCVTISDTQRYCCLGNAVTVNVISEIMKKILISP